MCLPGLPLAVRMQVERVSGVYWGLNREGRRVQPPREECGWLQALNE